MLKIIKLLESEDIALLNQLLAFNLLELVMWDKKGNTACGHHAHR